MRHLVIFTPKRKFGTDGISEDLTKVKLKRQAQTRSSCAERRLRQIRTLGTRSESAAVLFEAASSNHLQELIGGFPLIEIDYADYTT